MKTKLTLLAIFISLSVFSQAPSDIWASSGGGPNGENGTNCSNDTNGNVFVAGTFYGSTTTFGTFTLTNSNVNSTTDIFIVKYGPSGNLLWARSAGGTGDDYVYGCSSDINGSVYVTGYFRSPTITFGTVTLTNFGYTNIFITKYDANGNFLWAKAAGGINYDYGNGVATDKYANVLVTGHYSSPSLTFGTLTLNNSGFDDFFIVKFDSLGNEIWLRSATGNYYDNGQSCSVDTSGNIFVTGDFTSSSITFGTITLTNASPGGNDIFLVKYDPLGNVLWAKRGGGAGYDWGYSCAVDLNGNVAIAGFYYSVTLTIGSTTLSNAGDDDIFIAKYDGSGNFLWARSGGGTYADENQGCSFDPNGNLYAVGNYRSSSITFGTTTLTNAGNGNLYIVKYDAAGSLQWAKSVGGSAYDYGNSCSNDGNGDLFVAGTFGSASINFGTTLLSNAGSSDAYVTKLATATGILDLGNEIKFSIYPNPSSGKLIIDSEGTKGEIVIYNSLGGKIYSSEINSYKTEIDLSDEAKGIYFIKIRNEGNTSSKKIIIE